MADGTVRPIEDVEEGDLVASRDPATGQDAAEPVVRAVQRQADALVTLRLADASHAAQSQAPTQTLICTPEHPYWVPGRGWVPAGALSVGDRVGTRGGPAAAVRAVSWRRASPGEEGFLVYNFEVKGDHTYFVGTLGGGEWVHNLTCDISKKGLDLVKNHLASLDPFPGNPAMLNRLDQALESGSQLSGYDANFYLHEANEATLMNAGMDYTEAHAAAMLKYGVNDFDLYHPDVVAANRGWFNKLYPGF